MVSKTRRITEGAMMIALVGIFLLINKQTANILESMIYWVLSFPMMLYGAKYGLKVSVIPFVSCILMSFMIAAPTTIFYLFSALLVGMIYGYGVNKEWKNSVLLSVTILMEMVSLFITVVVLSKIFGYNITEEISAITKMMKNISNVGNIDNLALMVIVVVYVGSSIMQAVVIHLFGHQLLVKMKIKVRPLKSIFEVQFPKWISYLILGIWILNMANTFGVYNQEVATYVLMAYTIAFIIGVIDGALTVICVLMKEKKKNYIFLALIGCFIPFINNLFFFVGVYDIYSGFRKTL